MDFVFIICDKKLSIIHFLKSPVTFFTLVISFKASISMLLFVDSHLGLAAVLE